MKTILEDGRKIDRIVLAGREEYRASDNYKITAYGEPGEFCLIPFLAVEIDGEIIGRVPAAQVCVHYQ
jgi:hypothetical protein